jgi:hypothetical protein
VSLYELLHCDDRSELRKNLTLGDRYEMALGLARILNTLQAFEPPIVHGHLTSHNIFLEFQTFGG